MPSDLTTFEPNVISTGGPFTGYAWSNPANWSNGVPINGGQVVVNATNGPGANPIDDLPNLTLSSLTLVNNKAVSAGEPFVVVAGNLTVGLVTGNNLNTIWVQSASVLNIGTLVDPQGNFSANVAGSTFEISSQLTGNPFINADGGTVLIQPVPPMFSSFSFTGGHSTIAFGNPGTAGIELIGISAGSVIEVPGTSVSTVTVTGGGVEPDLNIVTNIGTYLFHLLFPQITVSPNVSYAAVMDSSTGLEALTFALCYAEGTSIATPKGEVAVEALCIGDDVMTASGARAPIRWIGRRRVDLTKHAEPARIQPVRVARDAFGQGQPWADLVLSPDHALYVHGVLIPVRFLMNGTSIAAMPCDRVTYYNVELPSHDVLLANGLPAESYLDAGGRSAFDNGGGIVQCHPDFASRSWDATGCAPLVVAGPVLDAVRARLRTRQAVVGRRTLERDAA